MSAQSPLPESDRETLLAELTAILIELADGQLDGVEIDPSGHIFEFGYVDSLSAVMFLSHVAEHYGVEIDDMELIERFHSLDLLVAHLCELRS